MKFTVVLIITSISHFESLIRSTIYSLFVHKNSNWIYDDLRLSERPYSDFPRTLVVEQCARHSLLTSYYLLAIHYLIFDQPTIIRIKENEKKRVHLTMIYVLN